jgi:hypothetical protein
MTGRLRGDPDEMEEILRREEARLREMPYSELKRFIKPQTWEIRGEGGAEYQLEVSAFIEDKKRNHLRVVVDIDDKGWRGSVADITNELDEVLASPIVLFHNFRQMISGRNHPKLENVSGFTRREFVNDLCHSSGSVPEKLFCEELRLAYELH